MDEQLLPKFLISLIWSEFDNEEGEALPDKQLDVRRLSKLNIKFSQQTFWLYGTHSNDQFVAKSAGMLVIDEEPEVRDCFPLNC